MAMWIEDNVLLQLQSDDLNRGIQVLEKEDAVLTGVVNEVPCLGSYIL